MYISARERKILELLLSKNGEITVKELANELEVSPRTVHRDLKGVAEVLEENGLELSRKSGIGVHVIGDDERKERLSLFLFNLSHTEYTPDERQTILLSELLGTKEPVKLVSLANDLNVTIATISNDLNKIEERLVPFHLTLLRKRGYGVEIIGSESAKRKAMSKLIINNIDEFEFVSIIKENLQKKSAETVDTITDRLLGLVDKKKLLIIEKEINQIKEDLPYSIADSAYIGLVVHLALAIERIQQGEEINFDANYLKSLEGTKEFEAAKKMVAGLENVFRIDISDGEIGYITMHLMGAKLRNDHDDFLEDTSLKAGVLAQNLIRFVSNEIGYDLTKNISLFQGLVAHLRPALYRIKQNMGISNPLLSRIEHDYRDMFEILEQGVKSVFTGLDVPKEEIGYLVMHFASALLNKEDVKKFKTLVVCSSGIGTSKILSSKLEQEIPGVTTVNASLFDLEGMDLEDFDAIISTVPLRNFEKDYLAVSPLLSGDEIEKVKHFFLKKRHISLKGKQSNAVENQREPVDTRNFQSNIRMVSHYSTAIHQILAGFSLIRLEESVSLETALKTLCVDAYEKNVLADPDEVVKGLLKREEIGGLGIPGTSLALYHTRNEFIRAPYFAIGRLKHPLPVKAMDDSAIEMNTVLLMLSPLNLNDEALEILSTISSLTIRDEQSIELFQQGSEQSLKNLLAAELKAVFEMKIKQ